MLDFGVEGATGGHAHCTVELVKPTAIAAAVLLIMAKFYMFEKLLAKMIRCSVFKHSLMHYQADKSLTNRHSHAVVRLSKMLVTARDECGTRKSNNKKTNRL